MEYILKIILLKQERHLIYRTTKAFNNAECENYLSGIFLDDKADITTCGISEYQPEAERREFYTKELFIGGGGCGKTQYNLTDKGRINVFCTSLLEISEYKKRRI